MDVIGLSLLTTDVISCKVLLEVTSSPHGVHMDVVKPAYWQCCPVLSPGEAQRLVLGPGEREIRSREIPDLACCGELTSSLVTRIREVNNKIKCTDGNNI